MASFSERCEQVVRDLGRGMEFIHTWLRSGDEADSQVNLLLEDQDFKNPIFVLFETDYSQNPNDAGVLINAIPLSAMILTQVPNESENVGLNVPQAITNISQAKELAQAFLFGLNESEEVARTGQEIETRNIVILDSAFDAVTFGVGINAVVPFTETKTGCVV